MYTVNAQESTNKRKKKLNEKENPSAQTAFFLFCSCFSKRYKAKGGWGGNTKACVLIFRLRAPPGPLKLPWFPQSNYISALNPSRIATSHQGMLSAYKRSVPNGVPEVDFISLLQSNGLWYFPKLTAALPPESTQRCMGPKPTTLQPTASLYNNPPAISTAAVCVKSANGLSSPSQCSLVLLAGCWLSEGPCIASSPYLPDPLWWI